MSGSHKVAREEERELVALHKKWDTEDECAICCNTLKMEDQVVFDMPNCAHHFHAECIFTWLKTKARCPLCQADIK